MLFHDSSIYYGNFLHVKLPKSFILNNMSSYIVISLLNFNFNHFILITTVASKLYKIFLLVSYLWFKGSCLPVRFENVFSGFFFFKLKTCLNKWLCIRKYSGVQKYSATL